MTKARKELKPIPDIQVKESEKINPLEVLTSVLQGHKTALRLFLEHPAYKAFEKYVIEQETFLLDRLIEQDDPIEAAKIKGAIKSSRDLREFITNIYETID
jgi:hypothetical protein